MQVNLDFNTVAAAWFVGLAVDGQQIFTGRRLVSSIDLSPGHLGGVLYARDSSDNSTDVGYTDLVNGNSRLYYITQDEIDAIGQRNPTTLEAASNVLPENFVDGGSIGVPIAQFASLQQQVTQQAQTISSLSETVEAIEQKCDGIEQQVATLSQTIASLATKEVSFSFNGVLEDGKVVAGWVSTKSYTIKATSGPQSGAVNRGTSSAAPSDGNASFELVLKPVVGNVESIGTVVYTPSSVVPIFTIPENIQIEPGETVEVRTETLNGLSDPAFTIQLTEEQL